MPASIFDAYVSGAASEFFPSAFHRERDRLNAALRAPRQIAPAVYAALSAQNARLGASAAREANLARLRGGAAAVVTGQQVGLFLGPLYTIYKAASAVRVARALAEASGREVVPVFWLQTEDHDLPEIAHCTIAGPSGEPRSLQLQVPEDNHVSIAHLRLPEQIGECHAGLAAELGALPEAAPHLARLARHYRAGAGWSEAFAGVLSELFEPEGLLVFDPRDRAVAEHLSPLHERGLAQASELAELLIARRDALERSGYEAVVHVRTGAPLAFFHAGVSDGPRCRLAPAESGFVELGTQNSHSRAQLTAALARDPLCFSSSALLRPIVQDWLLPTAAYVGGPAEVAYFSQLAPLYAAFELEMPLIVPRARLRVIEPAAARLLERLNLTPAALVQSESLLLRDLAADGGAGGPSPGHFEHELTSGFERVLATALAELGPLGQRLGPTLDKTRDKLRTTAVKLAARYASLRAEGDVARVSALHRLRGLLQPRGLPQERVYAFAHFAARFGERPFLERVLGAIEPFAAEPRELSLVNELTIALVCFPSLGGSGIIGTELAVGLAQRGHTLHVIAERPPTRALPQCSRLFFHEVSAPSYPLFDSAPYTLALASTIARVATEQRVDLVHVHYAVPHAASAYLARQMLGAAAPRVINTLHGTDVTRVGADVNYQQITRFCVEASDAISVPSEFLREQAYRALGIDRARPIEVIPNFVDVDQFAPPARREPERWAEVFEDRTPGPLLFHVSNFRSVKRVTDLLEVLARVRKSLPARLLLIGDGPDRPAAAARARSLGVQRSVCFLGKRADFADLLRHADAFLLTSETESFGLAALEALSCGVPVLGYRVGGVPAVVTDDVGRLVTPFDLDALAEAVVSVVGQPELREELGARARARVLSNFRREPALEAYERLYQRSLGER